MHPVAQLGQGGRADADARQSQTAKAEEPQEGWPASHEEVRPDHHQVRAVPEIHEVRARTAAAALVQHGSPGEHLVKGHYINVTYARPLFGHKPVLGKTYGRIWIKPHMRGNPEHGKLRAPRGVIRIGNIRNPAASQPVIPFPAPS